MLPPAPSSAVCKHCGNPVPAQAPDPGFCCSGCAAVYALLLDEGLGRYYDLARGNRLPSSEPAAEQGHAWLDPLLEQAMAAEGDVCRLDLDVQGIQCAACVWLMDELARRQQGDARLTVNPALGKASLVWRRGAFEPRAFVRQVEKFGYRLGPSRKAAALSRELPMRLGVSVAATMNVMLFSFSFYFGLSPSDPVIFKLFTVLSVGLASLVVAVGGWPFFRGAVQGLRRGVLHLDLPIALGILLVYATSLQQAWAGRGDHAYLDTLCTFVTLMLVGRWLQRRVLDQNKSYLLEDGGADGLIVRRREGGRVAAVPAPHLKTGDVLLVAPGDLVPVDAVLLDERGSFSLDWITGESRPLSLERGGTVQAGSFNAGRAAVEVRAAQPFADSPLPTLLATSPSRPANAGRSSRFFDLFARWYAVAVLAVASLGFLLWLPAGAERAIDVTAALLVVTCPCAIGLALPLASELVQAAARRAGACIRAGDLLDRLTSVRTVLFDKTGTLTLGRLELASPAAVAALPPELRDAAYDLAARSNHPVSRCLAPALAAAGATLDPAARVEELPGQGLSLVRGGRTFRLGAPVWAAPGAPAEPGVTLLSVDGAPAARFATREAARPGARREVEALRARGLDVWLVTGDEPARAAAFGAALGLPADRVAAGFGPEQKAALVRRLDARDTLFIGDGVNDSLAFSAAFCAGTPAVDRPVMPAKADFYLLGSGLSSLAGLIDSAWRLRRTQRRILALAFTYNALTISASLAGLMSPLGAAVAMPLSSLSVLLFAARSVRAPGGAPLPAPALRAQEVAA